MLAAEKPITLRHLLTHSIGTTYDWIDPRLTAWRISCDELPRLIENGDTAEDYVYPRAYQAGDGWAYSGGLDWVSLLVARVAKTSFEAYVEEKIAKPLGISSFTWYLLRKPDVAQKLIEMNT
jgi:CubicO group peptidase (beta-lactamase class C family)